jgi:hypothetical protein
MRLRAANGSALLSPSASSGYRRCPPLAVKTGTFTFADDDSFIAGASVATDRLFDLAFQKID